MRKNTLFWVFLNGGFVRKNAIYTKISSPFEASVVWKLLLRCRGSYFQMITWWTHDHAVPGPDEELEVTVWTLQWEILGNTENPQKGCTSQMYLCYKFGSRFLFLFSKWTETFLTTVTGSDHSRARSHLWVSLWERRQLGGLLAHTSEGITLHDEAVCL